MSSSSPRLQPGRAVPVGAESKVPAARDGHHRGGRGKQMLLFCALLVGGIMAPVRHVRRSGPGRACAADRLARAGTADAAPAREPWALPDLHVVLVAERLAGDL